MVVLGLGLFGVGLSQIQAGTQGGGMGYFMSSLNYIDLDKLNSDLKNYSYPELSSCFWAIGGGGHGIIRNKIIIGGEGYALMGDEVSNNTYEVSISGGYGFFDVGYIVYSAKTFRIYPLIGLGAGGLDLEIVKKESSLSFDDTLKSPQRIADLSTGAFLLNLALGADYLLPFAEDKAGRGGLVLGIRVGYIFAPYKSDWEMEGLDISDGPELGITGPYLRIIIGGGGETTGNLR